MPDVWSFARANAPMAEHTAAIFVAVLAEQLAELHADGRVLGQIEAAVRIEPADGRARPRVEGQGVPGDPMGAAEDVRAAGSLLTALLGARQG